MSRRLRMVCVAAAATVLSFDCLHAGDQKQVVEQIAAATRTELGTATQILNAIVAFVQDVESRISYLATSSDDTTIKDRVARDTIACCFASEFVNVQVAPAHRQRPRLQPINLYLHRLARLREVLGYTDVSLNFKADYLGIGRLHPVPGRAGVFEVPVTVVQQFSGSSSEYVYADATKKKLRVQLEITREAVTLRVTEILILEVTPISPQ